MNRQEKRQTLYKNSKIQDLDGWTIWLTYDELNKFTDEYFGRSIKYRITNQSAKKAIQECCDDTRITDYIKITLIKRLCIKESGYNYNSFY